MATNRIVLMISDDEIAALDEIAKVLDEVAEMGDMNDDYAEDVNRINNLYGYLREVRDRIKTEVLAS